MSQPKIKYDEMSDTLTVSFETGILATGIELTDHIFLRINLFERKAVSLVFFDYSILTQKTELGIRSFPLTGLEQLSEDLRDNIVEILFNQPVCEFLSVFAYSPSFKEITPIISVKPLLIAV